MAVLYDVSLEAIIDAAPMLDGGLQADTERRAPGVGEPLAAVVSGSDEADEGPPTAPPKLPPGEDAHGDHEHAPPIADVESVGEGEWFAGPDAHSRKRRELRDALLADGHTSIEANEVAIASHPPSCDAQATYDFYVELEKLAENFNHQRGVAPVAGIPALARRSLQRMQNAASSHGARDYARAFAALRPTEESIQAVEPNPLQVPRRDLEHLRAVVEDRRIIFVDERGNGHERRFDAYVTATRAEGVLASGFDHQRGVVRAIDLSALATLPRLAAGPDAHFDPPDERMVGEARRALDAIQPDAGSLRRVEASDLLAPLEGQRAEVEASDSSPVASTAVVDEAEFPTAIDLIVGSHHLFLDREIRSAGAIGFVLTDPDTGKPARGGVRLRDDGVLPAFVTIGEERVDLGHSYSWLPDENRYATQPEPFDRARASHANLVIAGSDFGLDLRVGRRTTGQWIVKAKLTPVSEPGATTGEGHMPPKSSIKSAPVLPTPLFKLDGRWHWRWGVRTADSHLILPRQLFELNGVEFEALRSVHLADGSTIEVAPTKYGTGSSLHRLGALRKVSKGKPGDYVFITVDAQASLSFHRVTKQLMARVQSHMKMASLLCGLTEEHPTLSAVLWSLGVVDESGTIDDAIAICEQRSDGPLVRELRAYAREAGPPPDLDDIFKAL